MEKSIEKTVLEIKKAFEQYYPFYSKLEESGSPKTFTLPGIRANLNNVSQGDLLDAIQFLINDKQIELSPKSDSERIFIVNESFLK